MTAFRVITGDIAKPIGFKATGVYSGIKKTQSLDLGFILSEQPATAAGVYTTNLFQAAPLKVTQKSIEKDGKLQAVIVNSGNANACTGTKGIDDAYTMQSLVSQQFNVPSGLIAVASTGVIGEYLPMNKVEEGITKLPQALTQNSGPLFSQAIMTTDLVEKTVCVELDIDGHVVTIAGTAKGSGMIHPNMATMLGFVTTDAAIEDSYLQASLKRATNETFNMITVDGDTSTNDMVVVLANGMAGNQPLSDKHSAANLFYEAFCYVLKELAKKIARDGEGATKLLEVEVTGALNEDTARQIAKSVIGSNLVKTAIYGADANWGRIICAVGYSGASFDPDSVDVSLGSIPVVKNSFPVPFSEEEALQYLKGENVAVHINLNQGSSSTTAWGCDLTYDYIKINASYRT